MGRFIASAIVASATALTTAAGSAAAEDNNVERVFGLWQSGETYLELNIDGTFFCAEQSAQDDIFGTFVVQGNVVKFTYGLGENILTTQKTLYFPSGDETRMQLVDTQQQSLQYRKLRDF